MTQPLVSVICLCYNQARFVQETINSVFAQSYGNVEVVVVDDASTDDSQEVIEKCLIGRNVPFVFHEKNLGNTITFNSGLALATGKYVIDLACDDILKPDRIARQVAFFEKQSEDVGVIYSDAQYIDEKTQTLERHFSNPRRKPYTGEIYEKVVSTYFIPPPTMMMRKQVLDDLGGYDESLAYEDFDFWVRSARHWKYAYQNEVLTYIRRVKGSHSSTLYIHGDRKLQSTIRVCEKIKKMNKSDEENSALIQRLRYEIKHAFLTGNKKEVLVLGRMLEDLRGENFVYRIIRLINPLGINLSYFRSWLIKWTS